MELKITLLNPWHLPTACKDSSHPPHLDGITIWFNHICNLLEGNVQDWRTKEVALVQLITHWAVLTRFWTLLHNTPWLLDVITDRRVLDLARLIMIACTTDRERPLQHTHLVYAIHRNLHQWSWPATMSDKGIHDLCFLIWVHRWSKRSISEVEVYQPWLLVILRFRCTSIWD